MKRMLDSKKIKILDNVSESGTTHIVIDKELTVKGEVAASGNLVGLGIRLSDGSKVTSLSQVGNALQIKPSNNAAVVLPNTGGLQVGTSTITTVTGNEIASSRVRVDN